MPPNQFIPPGRYSTIASSSSANTGGNLDPSDGYMLQRDGHSSDNRPSVYGSSFTQFSVPLSQNDEGTTTSEPITEFRLAYRAINNSTAPDTSFSNQPQNIGPIHYQPVTPVTVRQAFATTPSNIWPNSSYLGAQALQPQQTFPPEAPSIRGDLQQYQASPNTSMWQHYASGLRPTAIKLPPPQMSNEAIASTSQVPVIPNVQRPRSRRPSPLPPNNLTAYGGDRPASNTLESRKRTLGAMESPAKRQRTSSELAMAGVQSGARASTSSDGLLNVPPHPWSTASQDITTFSVSAQSIKMSTQDALVMSSSQPATLSSWPTAVGSSVGGRGFQSYIQATGNAQSERIQHVGSEALHRLNETGIAQVQHVAPMDSLRNATINVFKQQKSPWPLETLPVSYSQQLALDWQNNYFTYPPRGANPSQPTQVYGPLSTEVHTRPSVPFSSRPLSRTGVHLSLSVDRPRSRHPSSLVCNPVLNPNVNTSNLKLDEQALVNFRSDKGKCRMDEAQLDPREQRTLHDASQPISMSQLGFHASQSSHVLQTSSGNSGAPSESHANMLGVVPVAHSRAAKLQVHPQRVGDWRRGSSQALVGEGGSGHVSQGVSVVHQDNTGYFHGAHDFVISNSNFYNAPVQHPQNQPTRAEVLHWLQGYVMKGAEFDSWERDPPPKCHPETRTNILQRAHGWFDNSQREKQLTWLRGPAGVGKSAIVQTLAETLSKTKRLGASIFFSRPNGRSNPQQIFPTLAYRLATLDDAYNAYIGELKYEDPLSLDKSRSEQFRLLFVEPFARRKLRKGQKDLLVAIDGLDECDGDPVSEYASESLHRGRVAEQVQCEIVRLVSDFVQRHPSVPLVWIIASRPENHLKAVFMAGDVKDSYLEEDIPVDSDEACRDVEKFLHTSFTKIQEDYPDIIPHGPWPSNEQFLLIAKAALGLFVFAEVVVRFIGDPAVGNPVSQLSYVLSAVAKLRHNAQRKNPLAVLDAIYAAIMSRLPPDCLDNAKKLLPPLIHLHRRSVKISDINFKNVYQSLKIARADAVAALRHLHSVIYFPRAKDFDETRPRVYHASFHDFLEDPSRSNEYTVTRVEKLDAQLAFQYCLPKIFMYESSFTQLSVPLSRNDEGTITPEPIAELRLAHCATDSSTAPDTSFSNQSQNIGPVPHQPLTPLQPQRTFPPEAPSIHSDLQQHQASPNTSMRQHHKSSFQPAAAKLPTPQMSNETIASTVRFRLAYVVTATKMPSTLSQSQVPVIPNVQRPRGRRPPLLPPNNATTYGGDRSTSNIPESRKRTHDAMESPAKRQRTSSELATLSVPPPPWSTASQDITTSLVSAQSIKTSTQDTLAMSSSQSSLSSWPTAAGSSVGGRGIQSYIQATGNAQSERIQHVGSEDEYQLRPSSLIPNTRVIKALHRLNETGIAQVQPEAPMDSLRNATINVFEQEKSPWLQGTISDPYSLAYNPQNNHHTYPPKGAYPSQPTQAYGLLSTERVHTRPFSSRPSPRVDVHPSHLIVDRPCSRHSSPLVYNPTLNSNVNTSNPKLSGQTLVNFRSDKGKRRMDEAQLDPREQSPLLGTAQPISTSQSGSHARQSSRVLHTSLGNSGAPSESHVNMLSVVPVARSGATEPQVQPRHVGNWRQGSSQASGGEGGSGHVSQGVSVVLQDGTRYFHRAHDFVRTKFFLTFNYVDYFTNAVLYWLRDYIMKGAEFDSWERDPPPKCHLETRTNILQRAHNWIDDSQREKRLMWLRGPAGVGKSAIVQTLAETLSKFQRLGASIFFSRPNGRSNPKQVFPTLAYCLATLDDTYNAYIGELKYKNPLSLDKSMSEQFRLLFVEPFAQRSFRKGQGDLLMAIDGLDECDGDPVPKHARETLHRRRAAEQVQCEIVRLVSDFVQRHPSVPLIWVIASRPENHLKAVFMAGDVKDSYLEEDIPVDSTEACRDVEKFLHTAFTKIQEGYPDIIPDGPWPSSEQYLLIARAALGLFAFAEAVVRFIGDPAVGNPVSQLSDVLSAVAKLRHRTQRKNPLAVLDALYATIMSRLPSDCLDNAKKLLPVLIYLQRLCVNASEVNFKDVCRLLKIVHEDAFAALRHLHSVICFPYPSHPDTTRPLVYHASFHDFLEDPSRSNEYAITRLSKIDAQMALDYYLPQISRGQIPGPFSSWKNLPRYEIFDYGYGILGQILENCTTSSGVSIDFFSTQCHISEESLQTIFPHINFCSMVQYDPECIPQAFYKPQLIPVNELMNRHLLSMCAFSSLGINQSQLEMAAIKYCGSFIVFEITVQTHKYFKGFLHESMIELAQKAPQTKVWIWGKKKGERAALIHTDDFPSWWLYAKEPIFIIGF
ncbi:hypothetical protein AN958_08378 [Leucoagaricus sp. SymC.cos]|nr:hypothetical protein AN958_08378 [Leucoagaricus sp. SymC.cos]